MAGFSFPPPPPPPPKASSSNSNNQNRDSGTAGRGRGRGRGRGGVDNRGRGGRGNHSYNQRSQQYGNTNNGFLSTPAATDSPPSRSYNANGYHTYGNAAQTGSSSNGMNGIPPGSYINPAFHQQSSPFASGVSAVPAQYQSQNYSQAQNGPSRSVAGHKRKLEALRGPQQEVKSPESSVPPSVPSFSFSLLPTKPAVSQPTVSPSPAMSSERKRTTNGLGLTPGDKDPEYSSSDSEDDADEEAQFAKLGTSLKFEHNGEVMTIDSAADLAAWKKERSKQFPTKARIAAKMDEKRKLGEERLRLLTQASEALQAVRLCPRSGAGASASPTTTRDKGQRPDGRPETALEKAKREVAQKEKNLEKLRKQVALSEAERERLIAVKAEKEAEAGATIHEEEVEKTHMDTQEDNDILPLSAVKDDAFEADELEEAQMEEDDEDLDRIERDSDSSESSAVSPDSSDQESDDSDGPPEEVSSKAPTTESGTRKIVCRYFAASGHCRLGDACRFKHERAPGAREPRPPSDNRFSRTELLDDLAKKGRKSIHDLMVEQEQDAEHQLAVQVIKYLGKIDFFAEHSEGQRDWNWR